MNRFMTWIAAASLLNAGSIFAQAQAYDFTDAAGVNSIQFTLDAPLEAIAGFGKGVSGTVNFDVANPAATTGKIMLDAKSLAVANPAMQEHLHSEGWLDTAKFGEISFTLVSLSDVKTEGAMTTATATGDFMLHGQTKRLTVPVSFRHFPNGNEARTRGRAKGDLLVLRSKFAINRSDFGIKPGQMTEKVAEQVDISFAIAGVAAK